LAARSPRRSLSTKKQPRQGRPEHNGRRRWPALCDWTSRHIEGSLAHWFGGVRVLRHGSAPTSAEKKYILGFHPHGLYPTGAGFLSLMPSFRDAMPGLRPIPLSASALFMPPIIKDVVCWAGFRQVSRASFVRALDEAGSVILCPGGQAEMVHTHRAFKSPRREVVIHTRHKGFCRVAIERGAAVVPVLALGETLQLRNLLNWPRCQAFMVRRFGFPFPYFMAGRWGLSPLPRAVPLLYVVGDPIPPPPLPAPGAPAADADVDALHAAYFAALGELFAAHRHEHPEYADAELVLVDD